MPDHFLFYQPLWSTQLIHVHAAQDKFQQKYMRQGTRTDAKELKTMHLNLQRGQDKPKNKHESNVSCKSDKRRTAKLLCYFLSPPQACKEKFGLRGKYIDGHDIFA
jgi:hypothetical protein